MKILVLGCGQMGEAAVEDLHKYGNFKEIIIGTRSVEKAKRVMQKLSGNKSNEKKLKQIFKVSNEARENINEIQELTKHVPTPLTSITGINNYLVLLTSAGLPSAVEYSSRMKNFAAEVVKRGLGGINLAYGEKRKKNLE